MIAGIIFAKEVGARNVKVCSDSQLITGQVAIEYQARESHLIRCMNKVNNLISSFDNFSIEHI